MMDRIGEWIEMQLVRIGLALGQLSEEQKRTVSLFLASLMVAAVVANVLRAAFGR